MADTSPAATELKDLLIRFSGRQTKRKTPHTAPALLAGLWTMLVMLEYLETNNGNDLRKLVQDANLPVPLRPEG